MPIHPDFTRTPLDALKYVASTPKQGEPEPCDPSYNQDWTDDMGERAVEALHDVIDVAREALRLAELSSAAPPAPSDAPADPRGEAFNGLVDALDGLVGNGFSDEELARRWKWSAAAIQKARAELASARLIDAAPVPADPVKAEMLEALKAVKARTDFDDGHDLAPSAVAAVEAAIARAEGRA